MRNNHFPRFGRPYEFNAHLYKSVGRAEESRDSVSIRPTTFTFDEPRAVPEASGWALPVVPEPPRTATGSANTVDQSSAPCAVAYPVRGAC